VSVGGRTLDVFVYATTQHLTLLLEDLQPSAEALHLSVQAVVRQGGRIVAQCSDGAGCALGTSISSHRVDIAPVASNMPLFEGRNCHVIEVTIEVAETTSQRDAISSLAVAGSTAPHTDMFGSATFSDCVLSLSDGSQLPAHRQVCRSRHALARFP
jgi:hypothetical protein